LRTLCSRGILAEWEANEAPHELLSCCQLIERNNDTMETKIKFSHIDSKKIVIYQRDSHCFSVFDSNTKQLVNTFTA